MISETERRGTFLTLLSGCESRLRAFLAGAVAAGDERADLFQDVVLILWRNFGKYDPERPFGPWAMGVAVRRLKEEHRRRKKRPGLLAEDHLERLADALNSSPLSAAAGLVAAHAPGDREVEEEAALLACLDGLPPQSSRLLRRRYFDEAAVELLCAEFQQSASALYQNLSRLRRKLADCIQARLRDPETASSPTLRSSPSRSADMAAPTAHSMAAVGGVQTIPSIETRELP